MKLLALLASTGAALAAPHFTGEAHQHLSLLPENGDFYPVEPKFQYVPEGPYVYNNELIYPEYFEYEDEPTALAGPASPIEETEVEESLPEEKEMEVEVREKRSADPHRRYGRRRYGRRRSYRKYYSRPSYNYYPRPSYNYHPRPYYNNYYH